MNEGSRKTRSYKRFALLAYGLLPIGAIGGLVWLTWLREPLLLVQSKPLLDTTNWATELVNDAGSYTFTFPTCLGF